LNDELRGSQLHKRRVVIAARKRLALAAPIVIRTGVAG
jgi:hypothetical protein